MRLTLVISLLLSILAVVFALQNPGVADVTVFGLAYTGSKALILIITFAAGVLVGALATVPAYFRNRRKVSSLEKTIAKERTASRQERKQRAASSEQQRARRGEEPPPASGDASTRDTSNTN
jgi:uncharacterized integral membrane protein